jgi:hypothetical protein
MRHQNRAMGVGNMRDRLSAYRLSAISYQLSAISYPQTTIRNPQSLSADLIQILETNQHIARLAAIGRAKNARHFQLIDDARGAAVTNAHTTL